MLSATMLQALNGQINKELYSAYLYLAMAAWFEDRGLKGFANWMRVQHKEEEVHGLMIYGYVCEAGGRVELKSLAEPPAEFGSSLDVFQYALEHEREVTASIHRLVDLALSEKDHATNAFLQWFVTEQVEEESTAKEMVDKLTLAGESPPSLLFLDGKLGLRTFSQAAHAAAYGVL